MNKHTEGAFEAGIEAHLLKNGYRSGDPGDYDRERALLTPELIGFVEETQPRRGRSCEASTRPGSRRCSSTRSRST